MGVCHGSPTSPHSEPEPPHNGAVCDGLRQRQRVAVRVAAAARGLRRFGGLVGEVRRGLGLGMARPGIWECKPKAKEQSKDPLVW